MSENLEQLQVELKIAKLKVEEETYRVQAVKQLELAEKAKEAWESLLKGPAPLEKPKSRRSSSRSASKSNTDTDGFNPKAIKD